MNDEQLIRALRDLDRPADARAEFRDRLWVVLRRERQQADRRQPGRGVFLVAAALLVISLLGGALAAGGALRGIGLDGTDSYAVPSTDARPSAPLPRTGLLAFGAHRDLY